MRITVLETRDADYPSPGSRTVRFQEGQTYHVPDPFGQAAIEAGWAQPAGMSVERPVSPGGSVKKGAVRAQKE